MPDPDDVRSQYDFCKVGADTTYRISCRNGDHLIWTRWSILSGGRPEVPDFWQLSDGDWFLVTTRAEDFPMWFDLQMKGPHIWKIMWGDQLVWAGKSRPDQSSNNGILRVFEFSAHALVIGNFESNPAPRSWGSIQETPEGVALGRTAVQVVTRLGFPRTMPDISGWRMKMPSVTELGVPIELYVGGPGMAFKPDYGLRLRRKGVSSDVDLFFRRFRLFGLDVIGRGAYSTTSNMMHEGTLYAVSLDFDEAQLERILAKADPSVVRVVREELSHDPESPRPIKFKGSVDFGVRARLGSLQKAPKEQFVPLIAQEIL